MLHKYNFTDFPEEITKDILIRKLGNNAFEVTKMLIDNSENKEYFKKVLSLIKKELSNKFNEIIKEMVRYQLDKYLNRNGGSLTLSLYHSIYTNTILYTVDTKNKRLLDDIHHITAQQIHIEDYCFLYCSEVDEDSIIFATITLH